MTVVFCYNTHIRTQWQWVFRHTVSFVVHHNHNLDMNVTLRELCREGRLKEAVHILVTATKIANTRNSLHSSTCLQLLQTCIAKNALAEANLVHSHMDRTGLKFDPSTHKFLQNKLIQMYANCGGFLEARNVFDCMTERDVFSWNMIISTYQRHGFPRHALTLFHQMQQTTVQPNQFTFPSILQACAKLGDSQQGLTIHQTIIKAGYSPDVAVATALIDMYAKYGSIEKARELFDKMPHRNTFSWTAMLAGYGQNGLVENARDLFDKMPHRNVVSWTAMIAGYAQNGHVEKARELFDKMPHRDAISWTAMISGYAQNGFSEKALQTFKQMQLSGVKPNLLTFTSILPACANMGALEEGMDIHQKVIESTFSTDAVIVSALIDMYAKCGRIDKARELFDKMHDANTFSWNAMIAGYAIHGYSKDSLELFELMKHLGIDPDNITFVWVLFACSHAGLVDEGCKYFNSMSDSYCTIPEMNHYVCIVDLLGRAGYLEEALNFIAKMPIKPEAVVWTCLLGACRSHKNIGIGEFVATIIFVLDPKYVASYVLLSNIYAEVGRWDDFQRVRTLMTDKGIKKTPGCSWIEVDKAVHVFCVEDRSHPHAQEICARLE